MNFVGNIHKRWDMVHHFTCGSNMDSDKTDKSCPLLEIVEPGFLPHYILAVRLYDGIENFSGMEISDNCYRLSKQDEIRMDKNESISPGGEEQNFRS